MGSHNKLLLMGYNLISIQFTTCMDRYPIPCNLISIARKHNITYSDLCAYKSLCARVGLWVNECRLAYIHT